MCSPPKAEAETGLNPGQPGRCLNVRIHQPRRTAKIPLAACLAACLTTGSLALLAGCSAAPAGAVRNSLPVGPVRTGAAAQKFAQFPVSSKWTGAGGKDYTAVVNAKTGTAPHQFTFTAADSIVFWLNCIGTGTARIVSPAMHVNWGVPCGTGANPAGLTVTSPRSVRGSLVKARVTSPPGTHWEIRVDAHPAPARNA